MLTPEEKLRYSRQTILPNMGEAGQEKIKKAKVLVIGAGGLGTPALLYLAGAGVGTIGIIDGDNISLSNIHRQIAYNTADIDKAKAETAKEKIKALNPNVSITVYNEILSTKNALEIIKEYDIVIDGSDNFPTRYLVNDACVMLNKPFVSGAVYRFEGQLSVFNYNNGPTYRCLFPEPPSSDEMPDCSEAGVLGVLPGIIGCYQAAETLKLICGIGKILSGKMMVINILENSIFYFDIETISSNKKIKSFSDYDSFCGTKKTNSISASTLKKMIAEKESFQLIDVRGQEEYSKINIGGELIPLDKITENLHLISKDKKVVFHCQSGKRSAKAIALIQQNSSELTNLYNLEGGIEAWLRLK